MRILAIIGCPLCRLSNCSAFRPVDIAVWLQRLADVVICVTVLSRARTLFIVFLQALVESGVAFELKEASLTDKPKWFTDA